MQTKVAASSVAFTSSSVTPSAETTIHHPSGRCNKFGVAICCGVGAEVATCGQTSKPHTDELQEG